MARRRASENGTKALATKETEFSEGGTKIKEEDEEQIVDWRKSGGDNHVKSSDQNATGTTQDLRTEEKQSIESVVSGIAGMSVKDDTDAPAPPEANVAGVASSVNPPVDLASIEWSYLDPQGQVQGSIQLSTV